MAPIDILTYILAAAVPYLIMCACKRSKILDAIGPIIILYALGIIAGFLGLKSDAQTIVTGATIPLAIPLILFGNRITLTKTNTKDGALAFVSCLVSVILAVSASFLIFRPDTKIAGMVAGCASGGTMNMAAIKLALGVDESTFVLLNTYDMAVSFLYMIVLLVFGISLARKILPNKSNTSKDDISKDNDTSQSLPLRQKIRNYLFFFICAALCCGISYGISQLFSEDVFMLVFILCITALGIGFSYNRKIRTTPGSYDMGMYLVYAFSFIVASMADFKNMSLGENVMILGFFAGTIFGSLILHMIFSYLLKIDADTAVIASNAFVNAPPSVPVIASAMKNRKALTTGLTIGIVGYAMGTYLGILISTLLSHL
ncbi:MAG: DUF819 family protein [Bacteroidales bacterium]|nr:DUF819 family protein [Bacteroidales bacterium]